MNVVVEGVLGVRSGVRREGLRRGRTLLLAGGDLLAMTAAYALTFAIAQRIAPLPPVSAPTWVLVALAVLAVPGWLAIFTAYHLYDNDACGSRSRASTRCATSSTRCSPARSLS